MHNFQSFIKSTRESEELKRNTIADAINLSEDTIQIIEEADNDTLLQSSSSLLKNQIRRYCEYLKISEKKIVSILNKVDILYYKKSRYGKLKAFDYINRLAIIIIIIAIVVLVVKQVREKIDTASSNPQVSKSSIIYTPIEYNKNNFGEQQKPITIDNNNAITSNKIDSTGVVSSNATKTINSGSTISSKTSNNGSTTTTQENSTNDVTSNTTKIADSSSHTIGSETSKSNANVHTSSLAAPPPATANINNMVIGGTSDSSASSIKIPTKQ
ncbi:DNA-binding protein [Francisella halioticida]|uniref:DNA-binding protein n=1 Tax=Francisella halioticida TaxID=549298 RepID=A0ABM6LYM7_9GAMM|nr:helix-turn-helix domain-containing protein [Francisella halioticida]ASG67705.1 DNA-binding protein [Francisella halioticida]BCD90283.1 DNA-binding protein [Francisella halioticida]